MGVSAIGKWLFTLHNYICYLTRAQDGKLCPYFRTPSISYRVKDDPEIQFPICSLQISDHIF